MKRLFLLRGLPGSGKSTLAAFLSELGCRGTGNSAVWFEADDYFIDSEGVYTFDPSKLHDAHDWCQGAAYEAMHLSVPLVIVSNTFVANWQFTPYEVFAETFGYQVTVLTVESGLANADLERRNEHGCPEAKIGQMRSNWEDYVSPNYIKETTNVEGDPAKVEVPH